jgi:hypothetical protein
VTGIPKSTVPGQRLVALNFEFSKKRKEKKQKRSSQQEIMSIQTWKVAGTIFNLIKKGKSDPLSLVSLQLPLKKPCTANYCLATVLTTYKVNFQIANFIWW